LIGEMHSGTPRNAVKAFRADAGRPRASRLECRRGPGPAIDAGRMCERSAPVNGHEHGLPVSRPEGRRAVW
jgi:hypothetical protein